MTTQKTIKTEKEYNFALRRIEELMDAKTGSSEFDELELLSTLAEIYEDKYRPTVVILEDTADVVGTVDECLYSIGNRVKIAQILSEKGRTKLLDTILEDIFRSVQDMMDEHCIKR